MLYLFVASAALLLGPTVRTPNAAVRSDPHMKLFGLLEDTKSTSLVAQATGVVVSARVPSPPPGPSAPDPRTPSRME